MKEKIVIIAEKPSLGRDIAKALGATKEERGKYIYNEKENIYITWVFGHFLEIKEPGEINKDWDGYWNINKLPMIPDFSFDSDYKLKKDVKEQFNVIKELVKDADIIYNAGDPDREGELLIRLLYTKLIFKKDVKKYRLWLGNINKQAIVEDFEKKRKEVDYDSFFHSAWSRQKADWLVGMNLTQLYTLKSKKQFSLKETFSVGRVQSAIVSIIAKREEEIENFTPEKFIDLFVDYKIGMNGTWFKKNNKDIEDDDEDENKNLITKIRTEEEYNSIYNKVKDEKNGKIIKVEKKIKEVVIEGLYSKSNITSDASKKYNIDVEEGSLIVNDLYEKYKILSYPRTDYNYISNSDFTSLQKVFPLLKQIDIFSDHIKYLEDNNLLKANLNFVDESKVGAHPGLHPVLPDNGFINTYNSLPVKSKQVLDLVIFRLLSVMYPSYKYESTLAVIDINGETFKSNGNCVVDKGWKVIYNDNIKDNLLPQLNEGDEVNIKGFSKKEKETLPPKRYTKGDIIEYMVDLGSVIEKITTNKELINRIKKLNKEAGAKERKLGIGTSGTRESILGITLKRGYLDTKGKQLFLTEKGKQLMKLIDTNFFSPITTALWEDKLKQIEDKEYDFKDFDNLIITKIKELISLDKDNVGGDKSIKSEEKCPKCGGDVVIKELISKKTNKPFRIKECLNYKWNSKLKKKEGCDFSEFI